MTFPKCLRTGIKKIEGWSQNFTALKHILNSQYYLTNQLSMKMNFSEAVIFFINYQPGI